MDQRCNSRTHKRGIAVNKQALSLAMFVAGGVYPAVSNALSLGDIESNSNLNQPLKAQIELLSTNAQEAQQLQVRLAPPSVFNRVGIDRPAYLESLRFSTTIRNGKPVIVVSSDVPIDEPFVNFLVEVSWPQGQLLKEYTVMLDPPVLMQPGNTSTAEATVRAEPSAGGRVARPAPQQAQAQQPTRVATAPQQPRAAQPQPVQRERVAPRPVEAQPQPVAQAQPQPVQAQQPARPARRAAANRTYRVRAGDTLYGIAEKARPRELTTDQMMIALYRANPNAFIRNNINGLKRGAVLRAPTMEAAQSVAPTTARQQVRQQHADWKEFRSRAAATTVAQEGNNATRTPAMNAAQTTKPATPQQPDKPNTKPRLEVLGGNQEATPSNNATAAAGQARLQELEKQLSLTRESISARQRENTELRSRLSDLESMLEKKNRLVAMGNSQMADLQNSLGNNANPNATTSTPIANGTGAAVNPIPTQPNTSTATQLPSMQAGVVPNATTPTLPNNGTLPNVGATTANGTVLPPVTPNAEGANLQQTVGNMAANQNNTINRTVPPVNQGSVTQPNTPKPNEVKPTPAFTDETAEGNDLLSMLTSPLALQIGAGSLLGLLGLGLLWRFLGRRRQKVVNNDAIFDLEDDIADPTKGEKLHGADVFANLEDEIKHAEQRHDVPVRGAAVGAGSTKVTDTTLDTKHAAPSEEDDVLMESNVYIAYGLHQQAESELKKAIEKHPQRLEYRHKLLENYFAANNRAAFDQTAQEFMAQSGVNKQRLWDDIVVWGRKISPDNPLYAANTSQTVTAELGTNRVATTAGAAVASVGAVAVANAALKADDDDFDDYDLDLPDLDLPQVSSQLKADLGQTNLSNSNLTANNATKTDDLAGINLTKTDKETTYSAPTINQITDELDDFDFDLDFDEPKLPTSTLKTDAPRPTASSMLDELDSLDFDTDPLPVVEPKTPEKGIVNLFDELDLAGDTVANKAQQVAGQAGSALNATAAAAGQGLDTLGGKVGAAATAAVAGAGALAAGVMNTASNSKPAQAADQALDEFDELDDADYSALDDLLKEHNLTLADSAADANKAALVTNTANVVGSTKPKVTDLELHIKDNDLNKILPENNFYTKSANSASNVAPVNATTATEEEWLGDIDDALSFLDLPDEEIDLHEAHISTKLDLARAYLDMGDIEGARSTLEEVVVEGNDDQRREAQQLLHQAG